MARNPQMLHTLVRMVDRANRIQANPYNRLGMEFEEAMIYRDSVEHHLNRLKPPVCNAVILMAEGYTAQMAAELSGISTRTVQRSLDEVWIN